MQNREGHWHLGLMFGGTMGGSNMKMREATGNVMIMPGYNFNKYLGIQYNQMISYSGTFTGIGEVTIMIPIGSMIVPYAAAGAGWSNMSGSVQGYKVLGMLVVASILRYQRHLVLLLVIDTYRLWHLIQLQVRV